ncbi:putative reverse transcriptase domain-containing protein [Tanacetum coccineum]
MSDSEHSTVTYTSISSDYEESSDVGSPRVVVYGYDRLPTHPPSPDYVPRPEHPPSPDYVPGPENPPLLVYIPYVPELVYLEFMPLKDDVFPVEKQPLPIVVSPTTDSPGYITKSDPEEDPEEEDDEDPEEDPADYPTDRDDDDDEEESEEEEEEHLALADSTAASLVVDLIPFAEETEPFETDKSAATPPPPPAYLATTLPLPSPPPSPLTSYSSPLPQISSPPFPVPSPPTTSPTYTKAPLGYRAAEIQLRTVSPPPLPLSSPLPLPPPIILPRTRASMVMMRAATPSTYILAPQSKTPPSGIPPSGTPRLLPIPLPTSSPPLLLPYTDCRADVLEVMLPPRKRLCIAFGPRYEIRESSSAPTARPTGGFRADYGFVGTLDAEIRRDLDREIGYGITDVWEDPDEIAEEILATDVAELGQRITNFVMTLNLLRRDRSSHARTARLLKSEARSAREAWVQSMDVSDTARSETTCTTFRGTDSDEYIADSDENASKESTQNHLATTTTLMNDAAIRALISRGVADSLVEHEIQRNNNLNGDGSQGFGSGITRPVRPNRECTYTDFIKCQPMNFNGTEGVVGITKWFERIETVFNISNCVVKNQVKFATCTLHGVVVTWWKSHVKTVGRDAAYSVPWNTLMKMMTAKYCPRNEIKKLEIEIWELKVKGTDLASYTQRFQELALLCGRMFLEEFDKIEKYFGGLPDMIHGSVMAFKPKTM